MSSNVLPMFSSRSFIVSDLMFRSLIHFDFIFVMVLESVLVSFFYRWLTSFPSTTCLRDSFLHCIFLPSFVKDNMTIGAWIHLWAILFHWSIYFFFVPVPYCLDDCGLVVQSEVRQVDSSSTTLLKIALAIRGFFLCVCVFPYKQWSYLF